MNGKLIFFLLGAGLMREVEHLFLFVFPLSTFCEREKKRVVVRQSEDRDS